MKMNYSNCFFDNLNYLLKMQGINIKSHILFFVFNGANYFYEPEKYINNCIGKFDYSIDSIIANCNNDDVTVLKIEKKQFEKDFHKYKNILLYMKASKLSYDEIFKSSIPNHHWILYKESILDKAFIQDRCIFLDINHTKEFIGKVDLNEIIDGMLFGLSFRFNDKKIIDGAYLLRCIKRTLITYLKGVRPGKDEFDKYLDSFLMLKSDYTDLFDRQCLYIGYSLLNVCYVQIITNLKYLLNEDIELLKEFLNQIEELSADWMKCKLFIQKIGVSGDRNKVDNFIQLVKRTKKQHDETLLNILNKINEIWSLE